MRRLFSALMVMMAFVAVTAGFAGEAAAACPAGKLVSPDTAGHCCWPGQAWSGTACVGEPVCPKEMALTDDRKACELLPCPEKQVRTPDGVHCCWPGQGWSSARNMCIGEPKCETGYIVEAGACTPGPTLLDTDQDLIVDADDVCPSEPEDPDGFEDEDGCADTDNDGDGIVDFDDACPNNAEDPDGYRDEDGCFEADNDQDGIVDIDDKCPDRPEDKENRGDPDADGCPDDDDQDGVADGDDQCPEAIEDPDGFEDGDGCPEFDNDNDGFADADDDCPNQAEDFDLTADEDGCAEVDDDADMIADVSDLCPYEAEDGRGRTPADGCEMLADEKYESEYFRQASYGTFYLTMHMLEYGRHEPTSIAPGGSYNWGWGIFGGSLGLGGAMMMDLFTGIQPMRWPRHERAGFSLLNPAVGAHLSISVAFDDDQSLMGAGLWMRNTVKLGGLMTGVEYRGFNLEFYATHKNEGVWSIFVGYDFE